MVALIRRLFRHRENVYALRWENPRSGKERLCAGGRRRLDRHAQRSEDSLPLSDKAIKRHLRGRESIGIYPLVEDDTCWFLACDLDGKSWQLDAVALLDAARSTECRRRWSSATQFSASYKFSWYVS